MGSQVTGSVYLVGCVSVCQIRFHSRKIVIVMFLFPQSFTLLAGGDRNGIQPSLVWATFRASATLEVIWGKWLVKTKSTIGGSSER